MSSEGVGVVGSDLISATLSSELSPGLWSWSTFSCLMFDSDLPPNQLNQEEDLLPAVASLPSLGGRARLALWQSLVSSEMRSSGRGFL